MKTRTTIIKYLEKQGYDTRELSEAELINIFIQLTTLEREFIKTSNNKLGLHKTLRDLWWNNNDK